MGTPSNVLGGVYDIVRDDEFSWTACKFETVLSKPIGKKKIKINLSY